MAFWPNSQSKFRTRPWCGSSLLLFYTFFCGVTFELHLLQYTLQAINPSMASIYLSVTPEMWLGCFFHLRTGNERIWLYVVPAARRSHASNRSYLPSLEQWDSSHFFSMMFISRTFLLSCLVF